MTYLYQIPRSYPSLYLEKLSQNFLVYSPFSQRVPAVLSPESAGILRQVINRQEPEVKNLPRLLELADAQIIFLENQKKPVLKRPTEPENLIVWWHLTNQCNLRCTYCYVRKSTEKMSLQQAEKTLGKLFDSAMRHKISHLTLKFTGGEPLLEIKNVLQIVRLARCYADRNCIQTSFSLNTNGTLVTNETAELLKEYDLAVSISLDGTESYHNRTRLYPKKEGSFKAVEKGIKRLQEKNVPLSVRCVITSRNASGLTEFAAYCRQNKLPFTLSLYRENSQVKEELLSDISVILKAFKDMFIYLNDDPPPFPFTQLLELVHFTHPGPFICGYGYNYIVIRQDGRLARCQSALNNILDPAPRQDFIETIQKDNPVLSVENRHPCKHCLWRYACSGGCPQNTWEKYRRFDVASPNCRLYKAIIPEILRAEAIRLIKRNGNHPFSILLPDWS